MRAIKILFFATLVACATQPDSQECATGITCPEGTKCAAVQQVCILGDCGDGIEQATEVCDDGNIVDGDGCAANCGSREACGDGVLNAAAGELCDDGNTTGGDGCGMDCRSIEICGNGVRDVQEVCDDGNIIPGDGCSGNCKSSEVCGNSIVDVGEKCDDGTTAGGCNPDCQGGTGCGDGAIDIDGLGNALEECDDGNTTIDDDCNNCFLNSCGDNIVQTSGSRIEQCEAAGALLEDAACNIDCTLTSCGDNKINNAAGEQCDLGSTGNPAVSLNADNKDCTAACRINVCGDLKINSLGPTSTKIEQCDDGNAIPNDACSNTCKTKACGNGVIETGEACDDFNTNNGDGCSSACVFERCGDGIINNGESCDGTATAQNPGTGGETSTCDLNCTARTCGDGTVNRQAGEECDDAMPGTDAGDACRDDCKLNICGDGSKSNTELCDDGNAVNTDTCNNDCTEMTCRDGILQGTEVCDDGNNSNNDGCLNTCVPATCGDGHIRTNVETCDNALTSGNGPDKNCTAECQLNVCGDGYRDLQDLGANDSDEACDDGNVVDDLACPYGIATCTLCNSNCTAEIDRTGNVCGDGNEAVPEMCDDGNARTETDCPYNSPNGMCMVCNATCSAETADTGPWCGDGSVTNGEVCDDASPTQTCGRCNNSCTVGVTAAVAATGFIGASDSSGGNIGDGEYFQVSDGLVTVKFEFEKTGGANDVNAVLIDVSGGSTFTAEAVRDKIKTAFTTATASKGLRISATNAGETGALLTNLRRSSIGNQPITRNGLGSNFFTAGMTGGLAGDCPAGTKCTNDDDCRAALVGTGNCVSGTCQL